VEKPLKIAIVAHPQNVFPPASGSVAKVIWESSRRMAHACAITIFSRGEAGLPKEGRRAGLTIRRVSAFFDEQIVLRFVSYLQRLGGWERFVFFRWYFYAWFAGKTAWLIRRDCFDLVHIHNYSQFAPIVKWLHPAARIILHMHCHWLVEINHAVVARRLRKVDLIVSPSESVTVQTRHRFPEHATKCVTVTNGVDTDFYVKERAQATPSGGRENFPRQEVLFAGRITPEKGVHLLVEAMGLVLKDFPHAVLVIAGGDFLTPVSMRVRDDPVYLHLEKLKRNYRGYLQDLITRHGVQAEFVGYKSAVDLLNFYARAAVVVLPTFEEAGPLPVLEAMSCEAAVVATAVDGIKDYVPPDAGFLVPPNDARALADKIQLCLKNPALCAEMGRHGRAWVQAQFTWERMAAQLLREYERLACTPGVAEAAQLVEALP
jgi:glycosyltransferase involved in cell wall biosynthesis